MDVGVWRAPVWVFYKGRIRCLCSALVADNNGERRYIKDPKGNFIFVPRDDLRYPVWLDIGDGLQTLNKLLEEKAIEYYLNARMSDMI
jgi:hypothetical protein